MLFRYLHFGFYNVLLGSLLKRGGVSNEGEGGECKLSRKECLWHAPSYGFDIEVRKSCRIIQGNLTGHLMSLAQTLGEDKLSVSEAVNVR